MAGRRRSRARRFLFENGLSLFFLGLFLAALVGQAVAGHQVFNADRDAHGGSPISFVHYLTTSHFAQAVSENWQSEYLQFVLFILATVWFVQRGSPESKPLESAGRESDRDQRVGPYAGAHSPWLARVGGLRTALYSHSLALLMGTLFLGSWFAQSVSGWSEFNDQQHEHHEAGVSWLGYLTQADFWENTLQNWQSEFLAVGSMAIFAVYLRERGSPESKPVGAPHDATGVEG
jgi:uncharacterized protein DUF6766